ncbi:MAG: hypothetical protein HUJ51_04235 [Eggerthellaceae bacterium]|nr:hypothetical protein [Eggerthellaceae bacterium]
MFKIVRKLGQKIGAIICTYIRFIIFFWHILSGGADLRIIKELLGQASIKTYKYAPA